MTVIRCSRPLTSAAARRSLLCNYDRLQLKIIITAQLNSRGISAKLTREDEACLPRPSNEGKIKVSDCGESERPKLLIAGQHVSLTDDCPIVRALIYLTDMKRRESDSSVWRRSAMKAGDCSNKTLKRTVY